MKREVLGQEKVKTPAGSFNCWVIEEKVRGVVMVIKMDFITETWYAQDVGEIMSREYDKFGNLESTTRLISIEQE